jgi:hypothetical protein
VRIHEELLDAFYELESAHADVRALITRKQFRRLEDAVESLRTIVGILPERPLVEPPTEDGSD